MGQGAEGSKEIDGYYIIRCEEIGSYATCLDLCQVRLLDYFT